MKYIYDNYPDKLPDQNYIEYRYGNFISDKEEETDDIIKIVQTGEQKLLIGAFRDQWGVWLTFNSGNDKFTIAQEDGTKSFLDGLIKALQLMKERNELGIESEQIFIEGK